ncbi:PREDICTED: uncharacterized protein LOC105501435 [Colobus angolensis palliatus]|uniref:uncharacterized protein LOC105501435 n=1 Tax=Colobus angolensis palliatus TaxID=336983 RepID=UPI0005F4CC69|nr:PREDICTED: uncharacterized protein LOC105501435 [Colobus angolensis palliatus]
MLCSFRAIEAVHASHRNAPKPGHRKHRRIDPVPGPAAGPDSPHRQGHRSCPEMPRRLRRAAFVLRARRGLWDGTATSGALGLQGGAARVGTPCGGGLRPRRTAARRGGPAGDAVLPSRAEKAGKTRPEHTLPCTPLSAPRGGVGRRLTPQPRRGHLRPRPGVLSGRRRGAHRRPPGSPRPDGAWTWGAARPQPRLRRRHTRPSEEPGARRL